MAWSQQAPTAQDYMQAAQDALQDNDTTTAIEDYLLAIRVDPRNWQAYQNLGGCYVQIRKMDDAKAAYIQSLAINPNNPELKKFMAQIWGAATPTPAPAFFPPTATPTATSGIPVLLPGQFSPTPTPTFLGILANTSTPTPTPTSTPNQVPVMVPPFAQIAPPAPKAGELPPVRFKGFKPYVFQALPRYNLPEKDSLTLDFGGAGWFGGIQNFNDFFGPNLIPPASSHTGWELDAGVDYAPLNEIQIGLHLEGIVAPVTRSQLGNQFVEWDSYAIGCALAGKYLIPLNSSMSFVAHLEGGYYTLIGSQIQYDDGAQGDINLGGSAFGGLAEAQLELFQVADKSLALDFGLGYRFLTFNNLVGSGSVQGKAVINPLLNATGTPAYVDFSGPRISLSIRFIH